MRYRLGPLLVMCVLAVVAGARSLAGIRRWTLHADPGLLTAVALGGDGTPVATTIGRLLGCLDGDALDQVIGAHLAGLTGDPLQRRLRGLAADGKTVRGASRDGAKVHLVAAAWHDGAAVLSQRQVAAKRGEITCVPSLLDGIDLAGVCVTVDACSRPRTWPVTSSAGAATT